MKDRLEASKGQPTKQRGILGKLIGESETQLAERHGYQIANTLTCQSALSEAEKHLQEERQRFNETEARLVRELQILEEERITNTKNALRDTLTIHK